MIAPISVEFDTKAATDALQKLAQAAIARPDLALGIAKLADQLFEAAADFEEFQERNPRKMKIAIFPSETFKSFLRSIRTADDEAKRVAPAFDDLQR